MRERKCPMRRGMSSRPLPQRRERNLDHPDPVVEVLAEPLLPDRPLEVGVRRRDDPHVDRDPPPAAEPLDLPFLEDPQELRLDRERGVGDLV
jgi:hypothetical protein